MGYMFVISFCFGCGRPFHFNADLVPSILVDGVREPICGRCVEAANPIREERGLEPIVVLPGAYEPEEMP